MLNKLTISAAALAAFGMAGAASAQEVVNIDVLVEEIAQLVASDTTGAMTVDGTADRFMGNTASGTGVEPFATGDYATVRLNTNHSVDSLEVTFPQTNGIRD